MQDGRTAVLYAALYGHSNIVNLLINANADINLPEKVIVIIIQVHIFVMSELFFLFFYTTITDRLA